MVNPLHLPCRQDVADYLEKSDSPVETLTEKEMMSPTIYGWYNKLKKRLDIIK